MSAVSSFVDWAAGTVNAGASLIALIVSATFAEAVARRYPWVLDFTPVNEPLTTARFGALYGHWYPHARDARSFARALMVQTWATVKAMRAIRAGEEDRAYLAGTGAPFRVTAPLLEVSVTVLPELVDRLAAWVMRPRNSAWL